MNIIFIQNLTNDLEVLANESHQVKTSIKTLFNEEEELNKIIETKIIGKGLFVLYVHDGHMACINYIVNLPCNNVVI